MSVDAKGYEDKPWWPYVLDLQEKIDEGGGGGGGDSSTITIAQKQSVTTAVSQSLPVPMGKFTLADGAFVTKTIDVTFNGVEYKNVPFEMQGYGENGENQMPVFTNYPFFIANASAGKEWALITEEAGTYEIEIKGTPSKVPYWNCHVTVTNEKNDTDLIVNGLMIQPVVGGGTTNLQVIGTEEFDAIVVDGSARLNFKNSSGRDGIVTSVTGKGVILGDDEVGIWGDVTITAKGSE